MNRLAVAAGLSVWVGATLVLSSWGRWARPGLVERLKPFSPGGAGPGAHSYVGATRWWNVKHPNTYAQILDGATLPVAGFEQLDARQRHTEDVLLRIRLRQGLPLDLLDDAERERASVAVDDGLLMPDGERLVLTDRGRLLADGVVRMLLD